MSPARGKQAVYTSRRVGGVRPSQMIHTYGPGAVVDLPNLSVVLSGVDHWNIDYTERITEPRLIGAVRGLPGLGQVTEFRTPPWIEETSSVFDEWSRVGVPVNPFPRWMRCTGCDLLAPIDQRRFELEVPPYRPDRARYYHDRCKGRRPTAVSARFLIACPAGHLDDFPWVEYVHRGGLCPNGGATLELKEAGKANRATDVRILCKTCDADRLVQDAFGIDSWRHLPQCRGRHPHLHSFDQAGCQEPTRALLLGASNAWFPVYRSALTIPTVSGEIEQLVAEHWDDISDIEDRDEFDLIYRRLVRGRGERQLRWLMRFEPDDIWSAIVDRRGGAADTSEGEDLRGPEWEAFTAAIPPKSPDFDIRPVQRPAGFAGTLENPVAVDRLREVLALCSFTRVEGPDDFGEPTAGAPIWAEPRSWLPAAEVRGEGLFLRLPESRVTRWERSFAATERYAGLLRAHRAWRSRRGLDPALATPSPRLILLHTLSHLVLHQVALEAGYSTASIRERLYCREAGDPAGPPMAGLLLYTASPDAEGTLGGLVALTEPDRLGGLLKDAINRARLCSTDPMCSEHRAGDEGDTLHAAACHACLFVPETSCERGNRYLDRAVVQQTLGDPTNAYFG